MTLMAGTSGRHWLGMMFAWCSICLQVIMGVLSGIGPYLEPGSAAASCQVLAIGALKCTWAVLLTWWMPHATLLINLVLVMIFASEGAAVVILWHGSWGGGSAEAIEQIQLWAFYLLLIPVSIPILEKLYDALFVQIIVHCVRKKIDWANALHALCMVVLLLPSALAKLFGVKSGGPAANAALMKKTVQSSKLLIQDMRNQAAAKKRSSRPSS